MVDEERTHSFIFMPSMFSTKGGKQRHMLWQCIMHGKRRLGRVGSAECGTGHDEYRGIHVSNTSIRSGCRYYLL